jgi:hypothetical protein
MSAPGALKKNVYYARDAEPAPKDELVLHSGGQRHSHNAMLARGGRPIQLQLV